MRAIFVEDDGAKLSLCTTDMVVCGDCDVIIKVCAAGVNRADIFQRFGKYQPPYGASPILGLEVSGVIIQMGSKVSELKIGDKVCALLEGGGYAQYVSVCYTQVLVIPENIDIIDAAGLMESCSTVWYNLFMKASLKSGQTLMVHGGSSGIGSMAIQIATNLGIDVYTTVGNDHKKEFVDSLGVKQSFNYNFEDFEEEIKSLTNNRGVDLVLDIVGGDYIDKNLKILAQNGMLICLSFLKGARTDVNFAPLLLKNLTIIGSTLRNQSKETKAEIVKNIKTQVFPLILEGKIRPIIDRIFSFEEGLDAHNYMEKSQHCGKIILLMK